MKNEKINYLLCLLFFVLLAAITFRCTFGTDMVFSASDMNIGRLALKKYTLPEQLTGFFIGTPVLGESSYRYILFNVLVALMPLTVAANTIYGLILVAGSLSMVWFLRVWNRSWTAAIFGAIVAFWVNSVMLSVGGHGYKMEVLALSVLSLCFIEKAMRSPDLHRTVGFSIAGGLVIGVMLLEQQDVALLAGLFVGSYTFFRLVQLHRTVVKKWVAVLLPIALVAVLISGGLVLRSYKRNIADAASVQGTGEDKWNYITQWSMVPAEWPDLIAPGWSGWSSGNPKGPYWGRIGESAEWESAKQGFRNFKLTSNYFGIIPFVLGVFGMIVGFLKRKSEEGALTLFWSIAGLIGLLLAFGKYSFLYKLFYHLPMVGNIRAPIKLLDNFQICLGIVSAYGLDALVSQGRKEKAGKVFWVACTVFAGLFFLAGLKLLVAPVGQIGEFTAMGFGTYGKIMVRNMSNAWLHAAVLVSICAGLVFYIWKGLGPAKWAGVLLVLTMAADSLMLTAHYFKADNIAQVKNGNVVTNYLKEKQGNDRIFFLDQSGIYNQWLASDGPYHHLNIFNIWQMPRMPVEYKEFLSVVGKNQIRLWELSSVKYIAAPSSMYKRLSQNPKLSALFKPVLNYQVPTAKGMRPDVLLEFKGTIPRFALYTGWDVQPIEKHCKQLAALNHNARTSLLLTPESGLVSNDVENEFEELKGQINKTSAIVMVESDCPAIVRFSQRYQSGWRVFVDGKEAPLLNVDYLCMGVHVSAGSHTVEFKCPSALNQAMFVLGVFVLSLGVAVVLTRQGGKSL